MFFKKKNETKLEIKPLNYWEINSYIIFPMTEEYIDKDLIINRLNKITELKIIGIAEPDEDKDGRIVFKYNNVKYEIGYYFNKFKMPKLYDYQIKNFSDNDLHNLQNCSNSLVIYMSFDGVEKLKYKLQLLIGYNILPIVYGVLDESAEKLLHSSQVKMIIESQFLPSDDTLYSIQVISDDNKVWMHTHGLTRYGLPELEILDSNINVYKEQYNIITTLANHLLDKGLSDDNNYLIALLEGDIPLIVTLEPWNTALLEYDGIDLGGPLDREYEHNTKSMVIFTYQNDNDFNNKKHSKISIYDSIIMNDPLFLISNEETDRMSKVAKERFKYVLDAFENKNNSILVKIGVKCKDEDDFEHIWFELEEVLDNNKFKAKLINKPYNIALNEGECYEYSIDDVTDWIIYMEDNVINPDNVFLIK